ncbi:hypothetical protein [Lichenifustis flavocetrariae]|uniref:Uncharacterized protein n=1 Tax=Lichenifustis flavocetrariae TaxID=2949735 RepID=A0AA41Z872_9HYPH|nr:hypothetical protein [Lichenifustis flavocetrariae]MCW6511067.1 hypothetical protein [Lichenifustis flavocetrariae]
MRFIIAAGLMLLAGRAQAEAPHCMMRILMDVPAEEAPEQMKSKTNEEFGPITQIKVNRKTGKMTFCGKDTYCYNSNAFQFITPCRIKRDPEMSDGTFFSFFTR